MRGLARVAAVVALALVVTGCATRGRVFDDRPARAFVIGQTTADQAIAALGPPTRDRTVPNGRRFLEWSYGRLVLGFPYQRRVMATFQDGRMTHLHAPQDDEDIAVF